MATITTGMTRSELHDIYGMSAYAEPVVGCLEMDGAVGIDNL